MQEKKEDRKTEGAYNSKKEETKLKQREKQR